MSDMEELEWDLPLSLIVSALAQLSSTSIARCALVSSKWLAASKDPQLRQKLITGKLWRSLEDTRPVTSALRCSRITCATITEDLVAVGCEYMLKVWNLSNQEWDILCQGVRFGDTPRLAFTEGGFLLRGYVQNGGFLAGWKLGEGFKSFDFKAHDEGFGAIVGVEKDLVASSGSNGTIRLWKLSDQMLDTRAEDCEGNIALPCEAILEGHTNRVDKFASTSSGRLISGACDGTVMVWNLCTKECEHTCSFGDDSIIAFAANKDIAVSIPSLTVSLFKLRKQSFEAYAILEKCKTNIAKLWFSGNRVVVGGMDGDMLVWDAESSKCIGAIQLEEPDKVIDIWCSEEKMVAVSSERVRVWDFKSV